MTVTLRAAASLLCLSAAASASAQTAPSAPPAPAAKPSPCLAPEFSQFDFWVGYWDVYDTKNKQVANSRIEKVYGCGVRENWMPFSKQEGGSLNTFVPETKQWEQFWIDSGGSRAHFTGGWDGKAMVLTGEWGGPLTRMTYTRNADGSVRQLGEQSIDKGKSWGPSFDLTYRPHKG